MSMLASAPSSLSCVVLTGAHGEAAVLQSGWKQVAAGVVYGSSTIFVYTAGQGVYGFTLEPEIGAFVLSFANMKMPLRGNTYSVNEANADSFPGSYRTYLDIYVRKGTGRDRKSP
jgi:fructose-1,6-bisphosphatase I